MPVEHVNNKGGEEALGMEIDFEEEVVQDINCDDEEESESGGNDQDDEEWGGIEE